MGTVSDVRIARRTGFCYGVREAIDAARISAAEGKRTHTLGQVVHNEGVNQKLRDEGVVSVKELDEVEEDSSVVIRAHGVTPEVMASANDRELEVIDGTCSWVTQEQKELAALVEEGYTVVLLGTPGHPEVVGLLGFAPDAILVDEEGDWGKIPRRKRMALLTQSTQPPWKFERLAGHLTTRAHELKIVNTVCPVTIRRQQDTTDLAGDYDLGTVAGDLTPLLSGYFDTRTGHKREVGSYRRIAEAIGAPPRRILFLSDVREELDAAREAGWQTVWLVREGSPPLAASHRRATRFDQIPM